MDGNTVIGYSYEEAKAYCPICDKVYIYNWNGLKPLSADKKCPTCGSSKNIELEQHIDGHISIVEMYRDDKDTTEEQRIRLTKKISDLKEIRTKFDTYQNER